MPIPAVQIPPDSTGKRLAQAQFNEVGYTGGTVAFPRGDTVTGLTSGATGTIVQIDGATDVGSIYVRMGHDSVTQFLVGENLQVAGSTYAQCSSSTAYYSALTQLTGGNDPLQPAYVDQRGSLYTRGPEGWHKFDALGRMQTANLSWIGAYKFQTDKEDVLWGEKIVSGGAAAFHANTRSVVLSCSTLSGASIQRTTHLYHHLIVGVAPNIMIAVSLGDNGKPNVTRRWGYYDDNDGLFFQHDGTTMAVGHRTSRTGVPVDTLVPKAQWNIDRLDGSQGLFNLSRHHAELTNVHIFWFDFTDSGYCRWGTQSEEGEKITVHARKSSFDPLQNMKHTSLPFRVEQINTGTSASPSELRVYMAMAGVEGEWMHPYKAFAANTVGTVTVTSASTPTFIRAMRAAPTHEGVTNRGIAYAQAASVYTANAAVCCYYVKNPTLAGVTGWTAAAPDSALQHPTTTSGITVSSLGRVLWSGIVPANTERTVDLAAIHNVQSDGEIRLLADAAANTQDIFAWVATSVPGVATGVTVLPTWREFR